MIRINRRNPLSSVVCLLLNLLLVYVAYAACRLVYLLENYAVFRNSFAGSSWGDLIAGSLVFDTSAIIYTNLLYIVLMLVPLHLKENAGWQRVARWVFIIVNSLCVAMNLADAVYFEYTARRTTATVFSEFAGENNIAGIVGIEFLRHWYIVLVGIALIVFLWKCYFMPMGEKPWWVRRAAGRSGMVKYHLTHLLIFVVVGYLCVGGMRGGFTTAVRPITISNANQYTSSPQQSALILNTPFSLIRTIGKTNFVVPDYFAADAVEQIFSPVHTPATSGEFRAKNVVVLIVESFGREYIGGFNRWLDNGQYKGYTPFVDSLMQHSATWLYSYCNGRKSIDGMPSILSSIPMFVEPFFLTPSSMNEVSGLAKELGNKGYYSAFFHGAQNGSMGFQAFAQATGFTDYFGMTEFDADSRFDGDKDFDGTWAIWDEPFLQFFALKMSEFQQPFVTAVFTASSHHPFRVPESYKTLYPEEGLEIHKCIRYTDNALRRFFDTARRQPWYENTIFVLTSDHTNQSDHAYYQTDLGGFCSPILIYDPSGDIPAGMREGIAQQIDIMPTVLNYLGYDKPYVAFGCDLFSTPEAETWAVNYLSGIYQYVKGNYLLQFDGTRTTAMYEFREDSLLQKNLVGMVPQQPAMERELKAIIQSYMTRMLADSLVIR